MTYLFNYASYISTKLLRTWRDKFNVDYAKCEYTFCETLSPTLLFISLRSEYFPQKFVYNASIYTYIFWMKFLTRLNLRNEFYPVLLGKGNQEINR